MTETTELITTPTGTFRITVRPIERRTQEESPRELGGNIGVIVLRHRRHALPREGDLAERIFAVLGDEQFGDTVNARFEALRGWLMIEHEVPVVLPVVGEDHSGVTFTALKNLAGWKRDWDTGLAGVIYADPARLEETGADINTRERIEETLIDEIAEYRQWACNDLYDYVLECQTADGWDEVTTRGDFYSPADALHTAKSALTDDIAEYHQH